MYSVQKIILKILANKTVFHLSFCLIGLTFLFWTINFYSGGLKLSKVQPILIAYFFFLACVYTGRWLCKKFFLQNKVVFFVLYSFIACLILVYSGGFLIRYLYNFDKKRLDEFLVTIAPLFVISGIIGIFFTLIRATLRKQVEEANAAAAQKQSELNLLQSQLSPHFLFNTLNNIYGLSIAQSAKIPTLLLKLSDLLRYSVYEAKELFVPLKDEITYLENYIDFEKIRIGNRIILEKSIEITPDSSIKIAPMLLIVFIENAFKHAKNTLDQKIHIVIRLEIVGDFILFSVKNSYGISKEKNSNLAEKSGLGLANTTKRLQLLYADEYELTQKNQANFYEVTLRLKVK